MKKSKKPLIISLLFILAFSGIPLSGCKTVGNETNATAEIAKNRIKKDISSGKASSGSAAIIEDGKIVYSEAFGMANREKSIKADTKTIFNIGSISKAFAATAVMILVDEGKVDLDSPVTRYIKDFKMADPRYKDITVRMLLNHSSGFPGSIAANDTGSKYNDGANSELLEALSRSQLKAAPGQAAPYCNDGFSLTEILVARVSGQKYIDFLKSKVFEPLALTHTGLSVGQRPKDNPAYYYDPETKQRWPLEVYSIIGAGGLSSTPEDLATFGDNFSKEDPKVLSKSAIKEMEKEQLSIFAQKVKKEKGINPEWPYGLGLDFTSIPEYRAKGIKVIGKGGSTHSYQSMLLFVPNEHISVAVSEAGNEDVIQNVSSTAFAILDSILESKGLMKKKTAPKAPKPQKIPAKYRMFEGYYVISSPTKVSFNFKKGTASFTTLINGMPPQTESMSFSNGKFYKGDKVYSFFTFNGKTFLVNRNFYPGVSINMVIGQRLAALQPKSMEIKAGKTEWLRRNVKPFEMPSADSGHILISTIGTPISGYANFGVVEKISSKDYAGMPSGEVRDLYELSLFNKEGKTWAQLTDLLFSPVDEAESFSGAEKKVVIGNDGLNKWLKTANDMTVTFKKKNRVIVFSPERFPVYDSVLQNGKIKVKKDSLIELSGNPGDVFILAATK